MSIARALGVGAETFPGGEKTSLLGDSSDDAGVLVVAFECFLAPRFLGSSGLHVDSLREDEATGWALLQG